MARMECSVMDERVRFVGRLLDGEAMSDVCRSFGISRKIGYKIFNRYRNEGLEALTDRSRRPVRYANRRRTSRTGVPGRYASFWCASLPAMSASRPRAPCCRARSPRPGRPRLPAQAGLQG